MLSNSGETAEVIRLMTLVKKVGAKIIAITSSSETTLGRESDYTLAIGSYQEACPLGLAPSTSTSAMLAMGDALALAVLDLRGFTKEKFAFFHPGGSLGRRLLKVNDLMRTGAECPVIDENDFIRSAIEKITSARAGAAAVVSRQKKLTGIFTDGDLRRYLMRENVNPKKDRVADFMTQEPRTSSPSDLVEESVGIMKKLKIGEMPVVGRNRKVLGMLNLKDCLDIS